MYLKLFFLFINLIIADKIKIPFAHFDAIPSSIQKVLDIYNTDKGLFEFVDYQCTSEELEPINSTIWGIKTEGYSVVFSYFENINPSILNEIGQNSSMYIWNSYSYLGHSCYSNLVTGYDTTISALRAIDSRDDIDNVILLFDSETIILKSEIIQLLDFRRITYYDEYTISNGDPSTLIADINGKGDFVLLNFMKYSDKAKILFSSWQTAFGSDSDPAIKIFSFQNYNVSNILSDLNAVGTYYVSENIHIADDVKTAFDTETPSFESIILYSLLGIYYQSGNNMNYFSNAGHIAYSAYGKSYNVDGIDTGLKVNNKLIKDIEIYKIKKGADGISAVGKDVPEEDVTIVEIVNDVYYSLVDGLQVSAICNLKESKEYYKPDVLYVVLMAYLSFTSGNVLSDYDDGVDDAIIAAVEKINNEGGILGKVCQVIFIDITVDPDIAYEDFKNNYNTYSIMAIFSTASKEYEEKFLSLLEYDVLYFSLTHDAGDNCRKNVMAGLSIYSLWKYGIKVMTEIVDYRNLVVLYTTEEFSTKALDAIEYLNQDSDTTIIEYIEVPYTNDVIATNTCDRIRGACQDQGCIVINLMERQYHKNFFAKYKENNLDKNLYPVLSFTLSETIIDVDGKTNFDGHYIVSYYFHNYESEVANEFKGYMLKKGYEKTSFLMGFVYSELLLFANVVEITRSTSHNDIVKVLRYSRGKEEAGGVMELNKQGYLNTKLHLGKIDENGNVNIIDSCVYVEQTNAYSDVKYQCEWLEGIKTEYEFFKVVFIYVINDYNSDYLPYYSNYADVIVAYINNLGGISNHLIQKIMRTFDSVEKLEEYMKIQYNNPEILAFFGTTTNEERELIHDDLVKGDKLLFSIHPAEGQQCLDNVIQIGRYPNYYIINLLSNIYVLAEDKVCELIAWDSQYPANIMRSIYQTVLTVEGLKCNITIVKDDDEIKDFVNEKIDIIIDNNYTKIVVISALGTHINEMLTDMYELMDEKSLSNLFTVFSVDTLFEFVENYTIWDNNYIISSYEHTVDNDENNILTKAFEVTFGGISTLLTEDSINIYTAMMFLKTAYETATETTVSELKRQFKQITLSLPIGKISFNSYNSVSNYYSASKFYKDGYYERRVRSINPITISPYITYVFILYFRGLMEIMIHVY